MSDGGCTNPGDVAKAFGAGADFVMMGGLFAGHDESGGELIEKVRNYLTNTIIVVNFPERPEVQAVLRHEQRHGDEEAPRIRRGVQSVGGQDHHDPLQVCFPNLPEK